MCAKFFGAVFEIKTRRLVLIEKGKLSGVGVVETRGGDRKAQKYADRKSSVRAFIGKLKITESHYGRQKSKGLYLSSEYTVLSLRRLYNESVSADLKVWVTNF